MASSIFSSRLVHHFAVVGLEKMKFCFEICGEIVSPSDFVIVAWTHAYSFLRLMVFHFVIVAWSHAYSFLRLMVFYFELVELSMNLENIVDKVIRRTSWLKIGLRGGESPFTLRRVKIIIEIMIIRLGAWVILIRIRPLRHTRLVKVMICQVGNI